MLLATIKDASAIANLHQASFAKGWSADDIENMLESDDIFALMNEGKEAMIICKIAVDEAEVYTICVHPSARGKGLGFALLSAALGLAKEKGAKAMFLEVDIENTAAINLYKKAGFANVGIRKAYYHHENQAPTDAMILKMSL